MCRSQKVVVRGTCLFRKVYMVTVTKVTKRYAFFCCIEWIWVGEILRLDTIRSMTDVQWSIVLFWVTDYKNEYPGNLISQSLIKISSQNFWQSLLLITLSKNPALVLIWIQTRNIPPSLNQAVSNIPPLTSVTDIRIRMRIRPFPHTVIQHCWVKYGWIQAR